IPVSHVDEVLYEALVTDGRAGFEKLIDHAVTRDEILFSDYSKSDSEDGAEGAKQPPIGDVVTH
ncbi:MAG: hypothetical protein KDD70_13155, partial [Bdellovibrionales bacterium]|nr:hypothetical protein [Bdellovibrionales bacterium]